MSHWGNHIASNVYIILLLIFFINIIPIHIHHHHPLCLWIDKYIIPNNRTYVTNKSKVYNKNISLNENILSIIYGSLLGKSNIQKYTKGTNISFYIESSHSDYLLYFHNLITNLGYCNYNIPKLGTRLGRKGKIFKVLQLNTLIYEQFNDIYDKWYVNGIKGIPRDINIYLTPLAIAIWIMNNGIKSGKSIILYTNHFTYDELLLLTNVLYNKYGIKTIIKNNYIIIKEESMILLRDIVKPYIIKSMKYRIEV